MAAKARVKVPGSAAAGEIITLKTLISHTMESGQRKDDDGNPIPRHIINRFTCTFNGKPVFSCDMEPAVSANPYFEFKAKITEAGTFTFTWVDDDGEVTQLTQDIALK
ncbi:thiosulfate oxidation carrier complex protein SoxZ [Granulosicoccus sp. 3-233]|uniref:thiosulfate oxidation carrier complex protein SoxZ n=1 Tax=Granulosicoccus sp. 3-233 TaxID=3417969 RepID=UPI003D32AEFC